jgi:hypothetical protein
MDDDEHTAHAIVPEEVLEAAQNDVDIERLSDPTVNSSTAEVGASIEKNGETDNQRTELLQDGESREFDQGAQYEPDVGDEVLVDVPEDHPISDSQTSEKPSEMPIQSGQREVQFNGEPVDEPEATESFDFRPLSEERVISEHQPDIDDEPSHVHMDSSMEADEISAPLETTEPVSIEEPISHVDALETSQTTEDPITPSEIEPFGESFEQANTHTRIEDALSDRVEYTASSISPEEMTAVDDVDEPQSTGPVNFERGIEESHWDIAPEPIMELEPESSDEKFADEIGESEVPGESVHEAEVSMAKESNLEVPAISGDELREEEIGESEPFEQPVLASRDSKDDQDFPNEDVDEMQPDIPRTMGPEIDQLGVPDEPEIQHEGSDGQQLHVPIVHDEPFDHETGFTTLVFNADMKIATLLRISTIQMIF